jgi:thioredoxin-related protein
MVFLLLGCVFSLAQDHRAPAGQLPDAADSGYVPVNKFDPKRDAAADIQAAIAEAQKTGKRIILDVGGDWCQYCHQMDQFFQDHPEVLQLREKNFITVLIFYSSDNKNEKALSRYSKVLGIPHFFVLEKDGSLLYSQHVADLRTKGNYDVEKMKDFLSKWAPSTASKRDED